MRQNAQSFWKQVGLVLAFLVVILIVWNTNRLFKLVKQEERLKIELWAEAQKELIEYTDENQNYGFLAFEVLQKIGLTPIILVDKHDQIIDYKNIDWNIEIDPDSIQLFKVLTQIKKENEPILIQYKDIVDQRVYYGDSSLLKKLTYYPLALLLILFLFGGVIYFFFQANKASDQNRLWVGMAKETAHQIGTPLSSMMGWITLLKEQHGESDSLRAMENDLNRLEAITNRFSKIGSLPELHLQDAVEVTQTTLDYLKQRSARQIEWKWELPSHPIQLPLNQPLFSWALENLIKNGIDAMKGKGRITVKMRIKETQLQLLISDQGSGISPKLVKQIFNPGFTTKSRGWGLGLSLSRRIITDYHRGSIKLLKTVQGEGTTFEILLPKSNDEPKGV